MAAFSDHVTTFQPKISPNYNRNYICQIKRVLNMKYFYWFIWGSEGSNFSCSDKNFWSSSLAFLFHKFLIEPVPAGTGSIKNLWNKKALEDDQKFLSEQEKLEPSEPQINQ